METGGNICCMYIQMEEEKAGTSEICVIAKSADDAGGPL